MILGNTNGRNKGKKYIVKSKIDYNTAPPKCNVARADNFRLWFTDAHPKLVRVFNDQNIYDEDTYNDTYLLIFERIMYGGLIVNDFKTYFIRSFFTNRILNFKRNNRYVYDENALSNLSQQIDESSSLINEMLELSGMYELIISFVKRNYPEEDFKIFKLNLLDTPRLNYIEIGLYLGIPAHQIRKKILEIKEHICNNKQILQKTLLNNLKTIEL